MYKKVNLEQKILSSNEEYAAANRHFLNQNKKLCLNMISSPGSGKTTILAKTIIMLKDKLKIGVVEGDIKTDLDAERIRKTNAPAVQIQTDGACHLSAVQVSKAFESLPVANLDLIFIENVGNLVCPSAFELGETGKVVVLSVAEGDDKPVKYPAIFAKSKVMLINKIDLLEAVGLTDFNIERAMADARKLNKDIKIFPVSAKTGKGFDKWCDWLVDSVKNLQSQ
jgi:hydrogenase nickel incorporation protein HypB